MTSVAVVAHTGKSFGGGLAALRQALSDEGVDEPMWFEVAKSRRAPKRVRAAIEAGADIVLVWGGDGMVQRCIDAIGDDEVTIAIVPAGTANLLASNLGIPHDIAAAVRVALHGRRRPIDVAEFNGERFAVMAGAGWDALMIRDADGTLKDRFGRAAYLYTGAKHVREPRFRAAVVVDGTPWFEGLASCILVGNVTRVFNSKIFGSIQAFDGAAPDDGRLELGVITAAGAVQWSRTLARVARGAAERSRFVRSTHARRIRIEFDRKVDFELDGGHRGRTRRIKVDVVPHAVQICVPEPAP